MKKETESKIIEVLRESGELEGVGIQLKLEEKGYSLTYDTIHKYLKSMYLDGRLNRKAMRKRGDVAWNFYYSLK